MCPPSPLDLARTSTTFVPPFFKLFVGVSFGGYALIILYDVFFGRGLCGITVECSNSFW